MWAFFLDMRVWAGGQSAGEEEAAEAAGKPEPQFQTSAAHISVCTLPVPPVLIYLSVPYQYHPCLYLLSTTHPSIFPVTPARVNV